METTVLEVSLRKDLLSMLGFSRAEAAEAVREFSVLGLYLERKVSAGKAAELMGIRKRDFVRLLARKGIPYFDYTVDEMEGELGAVSERNHENAPA